LLPPCLGQLLAQQVGGAAEVALGAGGSRDRRARGVQVFLQRFDRRLVLNQRLAGARVFLLQPPDARTGGEVTGDEAAQRGQRRRAERRHHRQNGAGRRQRQRQRRRVGSRQHDDRRETGPPPRRQRQPRGQRRQQERDRRRRHRRGFAQSRAGEKPARQVHLDRDGRHL